MMLKIGKSIETRLHPNENGGQITLPSEKFELYFGSIINVGVNRESGMLQHFFREKIVEHR